MTMYSATSENLNYLKRVASHATKPSRTGRIDDIPWWADKPEANTIIEEYRLLLSTSLKSRPMKRFVPDQIRTMKKIKQTIKRIQEAIKDCEKVERKLAQEANSEKVRVLQESIKNRRQHIQWLLAKRQNLEQEWLDRKLAEIEP